jgi:hypothetical protein
MWHVVKQMLLLICSFITVEAGDAAVVVSHFQRVLRPREILWKKQPKSGLGIQKTPQLKNFTKTTRESSNFRKKTPITHFILSHLTSF